MERYRDVIEIQIGMTEKVTLHDDLKPGIALERRHLLTSSLSYHKESAAEAQTLTTAMAPMKFCTDNSMYSLRHILQIRAISH